MRAFSFYIGCLFMAVLIMAGSSFPGHEHPNIRMAATAAALVCMAFAGIAWDMHHTRIKGDKS